MNRSLVHVVVVEALLTGDFLDGVRIDGVVWSEDDDLYLRGGVVTQHDARLRRRVGVSGPGVEMAMDDLDLDGVESVVDVVRDGWGRGFILFGER